MTEITLDTYWDPENYATTAEWVHYIVVTHLETKKLPEASELIERFGMAEDIAYYTLDWSWAFLEEVYKHDPDATVSSVFG